ncbi:hypothetical protein F0323_015695 [Enterobacter hormaechei]|uniref:hypothetical protein n=1 Tax=Enterobacter hormaechei TaxID=158836 RepID=UPI0032B3A411
MFSIVFGLVSVDFIAEIYKQNKMQLLNVMVQSLYGSSLMLLGYVSKRHLHRLSNPIYSLVSVAIIIIMISYGLLKQSAMAWSNYPSGYLNSTIGALLCITVAYCLSSNFSSKEYKLFKLIGDNSKTIMSWHLSVFAIITTVYSFYGTTNIQSGKVVNIYNSYSFILYITCGILAPLVMLIIKEKALSKIKSLR